MPHDPHEVGAKLSLRRKGGVEDYEFIVNIAVAPWRCIQPVAWPPTLKNSPNPINSPYT